MKTPSELSAMRTILPLVRGSHEAPPLAVSGSESILIGRFSECESAGLKMQGSQLDLYYVLSTWNPCVVVLMKSRLQVGIV
jgi:hypothetical protein